MKIKGEIHRHCYMSQCRNNRKMKVNNTAMVMFRFPRDERLSDFWLAICNKTNLCPFHGQMICEDHFEKEDVVEEPEEGDGSQKWLVAGTIPKLNVPNISQAILEEFWHQKTAGQTPVLRSIKIEYPHKQSHKSKNGFLRCFSSQQSDKNGPSKCSKSAPKRDASSPPECQNEAKKHLSDEKKFVTLSSEVVERIRQVMKTMSDVMQNFMAYQIHIIQLQQKCVDIEETISNFFLENAEEATDVQKKFDDFNNIFLKTLVIQSEGCYDALSNSNKIWKRMVDCYDCVKRKKQLKTFITCASGSLTTIVKVIDAINSLKNGWHRLPMAPVADEAKELNALLHEIILKLVSIDNDIHMTRQKIIEIKKPAIRVMEITQLETPPEQIFVMEGTKRSKKSPAKAKEEPVLWPKVELQVERTFKELPKPGSSKVCTKRASPKKVRTPSPPPKSPIKIATPPEPLPEVLQQPLPPESQQLLQIQEPLQMQAQILPTQTSMQPQLIPTIQMDAFGNQSIVYQIVQPQVTYQQMTIDGVTTLVPTLMQPTMQQQVMTTPHQPAMGAISQPVVTHMEAAIKEPEVIIKQEKMDEDVVVIKQEPA